MINLFDLAIVGAGPAGLMAAKTAAAMGLKVIVLEKSKSFEKLKRACSAQFIMDNGYENEALRINDGKLIFQNNKFEVNYSGSLVNVTNKYYYSPSSNRIHFALPDQKPFAFKFDKIRLIQDLCEECRALGAELRMGSLACGGSDSGTHISIDIKTDNKYYSINAKKLVIAEGVNAKLTGIFGLNKSRSLFATAHVVKYILDGITDYEPNSWNLYYGKAYHSNAAIIIGPGLHGDKTAELTLSGNMNLRPERIYESITTDSPLKHTLSKAKIIERHGCAVKAFTSLKTPYKGNVISIGDSAAFVEVEVQGALMCGYNAGKAIIDELNRKPGFHDYTSWWQEAFEFNCDKYLQVSQGYALVPTYSDDELDYLFSLFKGRVLEGTYSQYKTPSLIWDYIYSYKDLIKKANPQLFSKIMNINKLTLSDTF